MLHSSSACHEALNLSACGSILFRYLVASGNETGLIDTGPLKQKISLYMYIVVQLKKKIIALNCDWTSNQTCRLSHNTHPISHSFIMLDDF